MLSEQCVSMFMGAPALLFNHEITGDTETYKALHASNLLSDGYLDIRNLQVTEVKDKRKAEKFILQVGDIILLARGQSMRCCIVSEEAASMRILATANVIILRLKDEHKGEFLVTYFNSQLGKQALNSFNVSSSTNIVKSLSLAGLKKLQVPFPTVQKQEQIALLFHANVQAQRSALTFLEEQKKMVEVKILNWMEVA